MQTGCLSRNRIQSRWKSFWLPLSRPSGKSKEQIKGPSTWAPPKVRVFSGFWRVFPDHCGFMLLWRDPSVFQWLWKELRDVFGCHLVTVNKLFDWWINWLFDWLNVWNTSPSNLSKWKIWKILPEFHLLIFVLFFSLSKEFTTASADQTTVDLYMMDERRREGRRLQTPSDAGPLAGGLHVFLHHPAALAPTSFRLNNRPCAHIPHNCLIKLLIAAANWRKWLCKYFLSSGFIRVTCWRVWQTRDTDPVPGKSSKEIFFLELDSWLSEGLSLPVCDLFSYLFCLAARYILCWILTIALCE